MTFPADSFMVAMPDGARLATDVYVPQPLRGRRPTLLVRLPYDKTGRYTFLPHLAERFTAHGFVVVVQDVRGKFASQGELVPFVHEAGDGAATLDWVVAQAWSNGIVGMMGDSYYGFTQWAAVASGHQALRAIVPRVTGSQLFRGFDPEVVPRLPLHEWVVHTFTGASMQEEPLARLVDGEARYMFGDGGGQRVRALIRGLVAGSANRSLVTASLPSGRPAAHLAIPALHMGGWWDNLQRHQLADWYEASAAPAGEHQFLRMGATDHEDFRLHEDDEPHLDHATDDDALDGYLDRMTSDPISFLLHYLGGREGRWQAPRVRYEIANLGWRVADRWAPAGTVQRSLRLGRVEVSTSTAAGGSLDPTTAVATPPGGSQVSWTHDPGDPVPWLVASEWSQCENLPDERAVHERVDVATFTTEPAEVAVDITGRVEAVLHLATSGPGGHAVVRLLDVYPHGRSRLVLEGAALLEGASRSAAVLVDLGDTAYRLRPGHRLRLALSASCFPLYPVHPGTLADIWEPGGARARAVYTLTSSPDMPSLLRYSTRR